MTPFRTGLFKLALIVALFAPFAGPVAAQQGFENLDRLDSLVAMTVGANRGEPGGPAAQIDRRLRLAPCPTTPSVTGPQFGAAMVACPAIGWRIRVPLIPAAVAPATPILAAKTAAQPQIVVKKGDPVALIAGNELFTVTRAMIADEDGALGAMIRVRQDKASTPVIARVEAMGIVRAPGI